MIRWSLHILLMADLPFGMYQQVEQEVMARAKTLADRTEQGKLKRQTFTNIANKSLN